MVLVGCQKAPEQKAPEEKCFNAHMQLWFQTKTWMTDNKKELWWGNEFKSYLDTPEGKIMYEADALGEVYERFIKK